MTRKALYKCSTFTFKSTEYQYPALHNKLPYLTSLGIGTCWSKEHQPKTDQRVESNSPGASVKVKYHVVHPSGIYWRVLYFFWHPSKSLGVEISKTPIMWAQTHQSVFSQQPVNLTDLTGWAQESRVRIHSLWNIFPLSWQHSHASVSIVCVSVRCLRAKAFSP